MNLPRSGAITCIAISALISTPTLSDTNQKSIKGSDCFAPSSWFPVSETTEPSAQGNFNSNCAFHLWSWQAFLWLTEVQDNGFLRFVNFPTKEAVFNDDLGSSAGLNLTVRTAKSTGIETETPLNEINQAGTGGVLVDHNGRAIYFSQHFNPQMTARIIASDWNSPEELNNLDPDAVDHNGRLINIFREGDIELKAAWKIVAPGEDTSGFFTQPATIQKLKNKNGKIIVSKRSQKVTVALVGLHVVGWIEGHTEAVWATFEHVKNAPDYQVNQGYKSPVSNQDFTFYTANTTPQDCNQNSVDSLTLNERTQTLTPITQACRQYPFGESAGSSSDNVTAIKTLNSSVWQQAQDTDMVQNYFEVGAIWQTSNSEFLDQNPLPLNSTLQKNILGSPLLSNTTIETFTQNVQSLNNCFSCHNTTQFQPENPTIKPMQASRLSVSHLIKEAYIANQPKSTND